LPQQQLNCRLADFDMAQSVRSAALDTSMAIEGEKGVNDSNPN
jgi:hypothetical protein